MSTINLDSPSVQTHINKMQDVINRMATNSASVKTWCITLTSAVMVFAADKNQSNAMLVALIPLFLCLFLDAFYLGLERAFREAYNDFIKKLHSGNIGGDDIFVITLHKYNNYFGTARSLISFSIWPFYSLLIVMVLLVRALIF